MKLEKPIVPLLAMCLMPGVSADATSPMRDAVVEWHTGDAAPTKPPAIAGKAMTLCARLRTPKLPHAGDRSQSG